MHRSVFAFFLLAFAFLSCGASGRVMDLSRNEAAERLKKGDIGFILYSGISRMSELSRVDPSAPFYAGLLVESAGDKLRAARLFEAALGSSIPKVKREAARKLIPVLAELKDREQAQRIIRLTEKTKNPPAELITLRGAALYVLGRHKDALSLLPEREQNPFPSDIPEKEWEEISSWNKAFRMLAALGQQKKETIPSAEDTQKLRGFFFGSTANIAYRWAYEELSRFFNSALSIDDKTAVAGRLAALGTAYSEALVHFTSVREDSLFFRHAPLLNDLGRAYSNTVPKREEGFKRFTDWESAIRTGKNSPVSGMVIEQNAVRYSLLFYAGRIRRQQGKHGEAAALFARALALTQDPVQEDACIWYILSSTFTEKPENVPALIKTYASRWNIDDEFYDILDRLSCYLVAEKKWNDMADVFNAIRGGKDGATIARLAYLLGRAVSLNYVSIRGMSANDFYTIAYEKGDASFYYRALAASRLGKTVIPAETRSVKKPEPAPRGDELEFFVKFFEFGARLYAMPYLRENADRYTRLELRILAGTFAGSGRYLESIQITGMFMRRENYVMETADLELYYPKPFLTLIEKHARANKIHPYVLLGLIRTESAFIPDIGSHAGAVGLTQIMPATGREVAASIKKRGGPDFAADGEVDLTDPEINVHMGAFYLKDLTDSLGSPMLALLGYNGGPARIRRLRRAAPSLPEDIFIETVNITETRNYGKRVMAAAAAYGYLYYGMSMHEVVSSIFK